MQRVRPSDGIILNRYTARQQCCSDRGCVEVDFILYGPKGFFAFEIKRSSSVNRYDAKGLLSFAQDYPEAKLFLVYNGTEKYYFDTVTAIPMSELLLHLPTILNE